jgi:hypothetical protein
MGIWWDRMGYQKHDASLFENRACTKSIAVSSYHLRVKIAMLGDFGGISPMFGQTHVLKERGCQLAIHPVATKVRLPAATRTPSSPPSLPTVRASFHRLTMWGCMKTNFRLIADPDLLFLLPYRRNSNQTRKPDRFPMKTTSRLFFAAVRFPCTRYTSIQIHFASHCNSESPENPSASWWIYPRKSKHRQIYM